MGDVVSIADLVAIKLRKEKEVRFYEEQIAILQEKLRETQHELCLNERILEMIREETLKTIE